MSISIEEVRHVAQLARLDLSDAELMSLQGDLNALIDHFEDIQRVDVTGIGPQSHAVEVQNVWADDLSQPGISRDLALRSSAMTKAGLFIVPQIIEE
jgi:aspartyl/glutamyl-tRNA(Asn/Gln) amidotransferase C subunit